jgi:hypothetical protein
VRIGAVWTATTLLFEFGLGPFVEHKAWSTLLADYDLTSGRIWLLIPIWVAAGPAVIQRLQTRHPATTPGHVHHRTITRLGS